MFAVLNYIHDHIAEHLNVGEVAEQFGYSRWYFCKKFHEYTHTTFHEYVRRYRIQLAAIEILQGKKISAMIPLAALTKHLSRNLAVFRRNTGSRQENVSCIMRGERQICIRSVTAAVSCGRKW